MKKKTKKHQQATVLPRTELVRCCGQEPVVHEDTRTGDTIVSCEKCGLNVQLFGQDRASRIFNAKARMRAQGVG